MDIVDIGTRDRANTKWIFHKLTNLSFCNVKDVPTGCKDTAPKELLLKNPELKSPTLRRKPDVKMMSSVCLEVSRYICRVTRSW